MRLAILVFKSAIMTIQYNQHICTASPLNFFRIMFRWRGSVWKGVLMELLVWTVAYYGVFFFYEYGLSGGQQKFFKRLSVNINKRMSYVPLEFILGFFVNAVVKRWTDGVHNLGYIDDQAIFIGNVVRGEDDHARMLRRTIMRYLCLTQVLVFRDICTSVRTRFPTYDCVVKAGVLLPEEKAKLESVRKLDKFSLGIDDGKYWMPISWAFGLTIQAKREGKIKMDMWCAKLIDELRKFQASMQTLCNYDWVKMPLAYPQFVFLSVHVYFLICLLGRQFVEIADVGKKSTVVPGDVFTQTLSWSNQTTGFSVAGANSTTTSQTATHIPVHVVIPVITMFQYIFYVGWMKVAGSLMDPFGEEDDDFECNFLIDRNFATALCIVDDAYDDLPSLKCDIFWSCDVTPIYSADSIHIPNHPLIGSAARQSVAERPRDEPRMTIVRRSTHKDENPVVTPLNDFRF